ncbi:MAG TPA: hypothetical protein VLD59_01455 [Steroidobacteraceae bacterium]|nr:hypothetical protein [Steroidobacteraceae bacterium]
MTTSMRSLFALTATALAVAGCGGGGGYGGDSPSPDAPPSMSAFADLTLAQDSSSAAIPFDIADDRTAAGSLVVSASSSNTSLIPAEGITFGGGAGSRTMTITPTEASTGRASVSVTVADAAGLSTTRTFLVTVNAVNVALTTWTFEMYKDAETAASRSLLGFTLQNDAEDQPDAFDSLL